MTVRIGVAVLVLTFALAGCGEDELHEVTLNAERTTAKQARFSVGEPDIVYLKTEPVELPPGMTEATVGTCPAGREIAGLSPPGSIDGNPSGDTAIPGLDKRTATFVVENVADETVEADRFALACRSAPG